MSLSKLQNILKKGKGDLDTVRSLYFVMSKVGGYEQLFGCEFDFEFEIDGKKVKGKIIKKGIPISAVNEILKCIEWENKEMNKSMRKKK